MAKRELNKEELNKVNGGIVQGVGGSDKVYCWACDKFMFANECEYHEADGCGDHSYYICKYCHEDVDKEAEY